MSGLFIAFEGGDGAGKSTQAAILEDTLRQQGLRTLLLHEPGSTTVGDYLREYLVAKQPISSLAELLLFEASRAELVRERIVPATEDGTVVICDRFAGSTVAYQGYGRGIDLETIGTLNDIATQGRYPDLTLLIDVDPLVGLGRINSRLLQLALPIGDAPDRFEDEALAFHDRVRRGFLRQAETNAKTWRKIEGNRSVDEVSSAIWKEVCSLLNDHRIQSENA